MLNLRGHRILLTLVSRRERIEREMTNIGKNNREKMRINMLINIFVFHEEISLAANIIRSRGTLQFFSGQV